MKCVSLENVEDYCVDLTEEMYQTYKANEDQYRKMWVDQKLGFWVKFVISLRQYTIATSSKYEEKCEKEFITFLKVLTQKNYNDLNTYITIAYKTIIERDNKIEQISNSTDPLCIRNVTTSELDDYSQVRVLTLKLTCAGTFINLLQFWNSAKEGDDFKFSPPDSWTIPVTLAEPVEAYIRAKWGGYRNVEDILGCKKEDLGWWGAPARKVDQAKLQPSSSTVDASTSSAASSDSQPSTSQSRSKKKSKSRKQKRSETSSPPSRTRYVVSTWMPDSTFWRLENPTYDRKEEQYKQLASASPFTKVKILFQHSILPFLSSKFHSINSKALSSTVNKKSLGVSPWFMMCSQSFGNMYMKYILECHIELKQCIKLPVTRNMFQDLDTWKTDRDNDKITLETLLDKIGAPDLETDCIESVPEFLLDPCVLYQLPWQPALFRQWLAAAHLKVMEFELQSMEFRHWPLPADLEPIVRELVALVTDAKERILLGWTVVSYMVTMYPTDDPKHHSFILDHVILPTLNTLAFLCTEKPYQILQSLKKLAWPSNFGFVSQKLDNKVNLHRGVYTINGNLAGFNMSFFGNFVYWLKISLGYTDLDPFPTIRHEDDAGLYMQLDHLENMKQVHPPEEKPFDVNILSLEEENMFWIMQHISSLSPKDFTQRENYTKMAEVVQHALKCSHFMMPTFMALTQILRDEEMMYTTRDILKKVQRNLTPIQQIALSSIMYYELNRFIPSLKSDTSVLGRMLYMSARTMEQEQLIRVVAACSVVLNESPGCCRFLYYGKCPVECTVAEVSPIAEVSTMQEIITEVSKKKKKQNREEFWSRFPEEWKKDVGQPAMIPTLTDGVPAIVTALEARVGNLVWNIAQHNFISHEKNGRLFPYSQVVQYMLPCYFSMLIDIDKKYPKSDRNTAKKENMVRFLVGLIVLYEQCYHIWLSEDVSRDNDLGLIVKDVDSPRLRVGCVLAGYMVERIMFALHGFVGLGRIGEDLDLMPHFGIMANSMQEFPMFTSMGYTSKIELFNCDAWLRNGYPHFRALHEICFTSLPIPNPSAILYCHELQDLYFASALIHQLDAHYTLTNWFCNQFQIGESAEYKELIRLSKPLRNWRYELFCIIFETEGKFEYPENMLSMFVNGKGKTLLASVFNIYKTVRASPFAKTNMEFQIPEWGTELKEKFDMFVEGHLKSLALFDKKPSRVGPPAKVRQVPGMFATCNNCHRTETEQGMFGQCQACIEAKYPFPNFFCSKRCEETWWKTEHMAEHLEFDLGLCDFKDLKVTE